MKKISFLRLLLVVLVLSPGISFANEKTILVFGDSLSAAYGLPTEQGWPHLLQQKISQQQLPWQITNLSISGETTSGGSQRIDDALQQYRPDIVILELGANDGMRGQSLKTMKENLQQMIKKAQAIDAQVILAGMHIPPNYGKRYTQAFHQSYVTLSDDYNTVFIPFILDGIANQPQLMLSDGLHPNADGQKIMLTTVWQYLQPLVNGGN
ncbi:acyl-CoA thioesterase-1 [Sinobacterium caligoides]|uniref:Acyl-CoA thioesterase-1 n=1 Tax=Sinobacterium caligoides TaxID=933926 RepID=A0A3N2E167_9GAMM|nr:arylesterase [Sinobacterium caligoides]ROS05389.1 acyl-CoA thioesterase-1 [Sinobacterium caligoides]